MWQKGGCLIKKMRKWTRVEEKPESWQISREVDSEVKGGRNEVVGEERDDVVFIFEVHEGGVLEGLS